MNTPGIPRYDYSIFKTKHEVPYDIDTVKIAAEKEEFVNHLEKRHGNEFLKLKAGIENISKRLFLFVGGNPGLMKELAGLHYCTTDAPYLCYDSLLGKAETVSAAEAEKESDELFRGQVFRCELNPDTVYKIVNQIIIPDKSESYQFELATLECRLQQDCTIFFDCLDCRDTLFLRYLSNKISAIKSLYDFIPKGRLIVSTLTPLADIPPYFKSLFEIVNLEPEKQAQTTEQATLEPQVKPKSQSQRRIKKLLFTYDKKNKVILKFGKNKTAKLTETEAKLFLFLKKDRASPEEIIEHIWPDDGDKTKNSVWELRTRINKKCLGYVVEGLISELMDGNYELTLEVAEF